VRSSASFHVIQGDWHLPPLDRQRTWLVWIEPLFERTTARPAIQLPFDAVCYRRKCMEEKRLAACDPDVPGLVLEGAANPCGLPYRLIDGNHRLHRQMRAGLREGWFFVFRFEDIADCILDYERYMSSLRSRRANGAMQRAGMASRGPGAGSAEGFRPVGPGPATDGSPD